MTGSVLFYVQYLLGIGHLKRALRIAEALGRRGVAVTVVSGGMPVAGLVPSIGFGVVQLPPVRARDASFALYGEDGRPLDEALRQARQEALLAAFAATRPDVVVLEGFPFARRAFRFELDPLIAATRAAQPRPRLVSSIRDILVARDDPERNREIVARIRADFDAVLVHGDPTFVPLEASFPAAAEIADLLVYTGYVAEAAEAEKAAAEAGPGEAPGVIVSAGGGAAGEALLAAAAAARRAGCCAGLPWRLITGPNLSELAFRALAESLPEDVALERFRRDFPQLLRHSRVSVSQAGYNTVLDLLAARVPAVLVPFAAGRETEQTLRAERLAASGAAEMVAGVDLDAEHLAAAIERALARGPLPVAVDTGGAERSAELIAGLIG